MIAFLVLAQVLDSYAGIGLDRLPDINTMIYGWWSWRLICKPESVPNTYNPSLRTPRALVEFVRLCTLCTHARFEPSCCLKDTWWSMIRDSLRAAENLNGCWGQCLDAFADWWSV